MSPGILRPLMARPCCSIKLKSWLVTAAIVTLAACSGENPSADQENQAAVFDKLSAECQTPLARKLADLSVHANDPLLEANFELANRCGIENSAIIKASQIETKADRVISPIDGLINFETPHVHPIDLTPDGNTLVSVNTAAHTLDVWRVNGTAISIVRSIPVGLDPVSVRVRNNTEAWVVNHISDSVSIVNLDQMTVIRTLETDNEPADIVFSSTGRAFVTASEANAINVFDLANLEAPPTKVQIDGEDPRSLAVSADGQTVFAAVFESGNGTRRTVLASTDAGVIVRDNQQADNDVAIIDATTLTVSYRRRLMNIVMAIGINPSTQRVYAVGTEAFNDIPNEPALNGKFVKVQVADFSGPGLNDSVIRDLNPHLDYSSPSVSPALRQRSIGDPRQIAWRADGQLAFITGMGSNNIVVIDGAGNRISQFEVGQGPTGLVINDDAGIGFVMNKFAGSISVIDVQSLSEIAQVEFDDPTPAAIKAGRPLIYDTHLTSGTGHLSCASCHVDSRTDRLGWQLSDGKGTLSQIPRASNGLPGNVIGTSEISSNKQVMTTQTLVDIMDHPRFHWRGDRADIESFNGTFVGLMGRASEISGSQMQAMKGFLETLWLPPNPYRNIDNSRPNTVTLPDGSQASSSLVNSGSTEALRGGLNGNNCLSCHSGQGNATRNFGANPEIGSNVIAPAFPALYDRMGFTFGRSGFGFFHNGATDLFAATRQRAFLAEILTLEGPEGPLTNGEIRQAPHAGVGQQVTLGPNSNSSALVRLDQLINIASTSSWAELVAHRRNGGRAAGFVLQENGRFSTDISGSTISKTQLLADAATGEFVTFTLVSRDMSTRLALDSNLDGTLNGDEIDTDGDGIRDSDDLDDDNDNVVDAIDAFPLDPTESVDTDGDGIGNNRDPDDDGDGVADTDDLDPLDPTIGALNGDQTCNLIDDGGFEAGVGLWQSNTLLSLVSTANSGTGALSMSNGYLGQVLEASPGTLYTFSGFYQVDSGSEWAGFGVDFLDANGQELGEAVRSFDSANNWQGFAVATQTPIGTEFIRPWIFAQAGRSLILDDLDLRKTGCTNGVTGNQPPLIVNPGNQSNETGDNIALAIDGVDPEGVALTFSATNLPAGLSIGSGDGVVRGTVNTDGSSNVSVIASDGEKQSQTQFVWTIIDTNGGGTCNVLGNGDFENGLTDWLSSINPTLVSDAHSGRTAARLAGGWMSTTVTASANTDFTLTGHYQRVLANGWSGVGIDYLDANGNEIGETVQTLTPQGSYARFIVNVRTPANTASLRLWFYSDADAQITVDAIDLRRTGCDNGGGSTDSCNAVVNPGFEQDLIAWSSNTDPSLTSNAGEDSSAAQVQGGWISQAIAVQPGQTYAATALVQAGGSNGWSGAGMDFVGSGGNKLADTVQTIATSAAYSSVSLTATAPAGATQVLLWFYADAGRSVNVDAVDLRVAGCQ